MDTIHHTAHDVPSGLLQPLGARTEFLVEKLFTQSYREDRTHFHTVTERLTEKYPFRATESVYRTNVLPWTFFYTPGSWMLDPLICRSVCAGKKN